MAKRKEIKLAKRKEAEQRMRDRALRSGKEQIARLDTMLGEGIGASKERSRLFKKIHEGSK